MQTDISRPAGSNLDRAARRLGVPSNRYEAAIPWKDGRSYIPAFVREARYDANSYTRWEMVRKIRYFAMNSWLIQCLSRTDEKYTVGPSGMRVFPASSNPEWNRAMAAEYNAWCEEPALDSRLPMHQQDAIVSLARHIEGEIFVHFTSRPTRKGSRPAIQLIEGHRVSSPGQQFAVGETKDLVDGVQLEPGVNGASSNGRPMGYHVRDTFAADRWHYIPCYDPDNPIAGGVLHIYDPTRPGMYRGVTPYHASLNQAHQLDDLMILEEERAREKARTPLVLKTQSGEIPTDFNSTRQQDVNGTIGGIPQLEDVLSANAYTHLRNATGRTRVLGLRPGEELTEVGNSQPSVAQQWYWEFLVEQICMSVEIPLVLVLPESYQGTVSRSILDNAHNSFLRKWKIHKRFAAARFRYFAQWAQFNVRGMPALPDDWWHCHVTQPVRVDVDIGRNSQAMLAEISAGTKSFNDVAADDGTTAEERFRAKAENVAQIKTIAAEASEKYGVEVKPEEISAPLADVLAVLAKAQPAPQESDNPTPPTSRRRQTKE